MTYTKTTWVEGGSPGISAANLNKIETGISDAHTALTGLGGTYVSLTATGNQTLAGPLQIPALSITGDVSSVANINATTDVKVKGNSTWHKGNLTIASTAPTSPQTNDIWIDTSIILT